MSLSKLSRESHSPSNMSRRMIGAIVLLSLVLLSTSINLSVFPNTNFRPFDQSYVLGNLSPINSSNMCLCRCYNISTCVTVTYIGANRTCILYSAQLSLGNLQSLPNSSNAKVYWFGNRNLSGEAGRTRRVTCDFSHPLVQLYGYSTERAKYSILSGKLRPGVTAP